ncbi:hypothetical protein BG011_006703 [Mortierella polycephala]|uniref:tRNA(Phe) 7-[(3-amino-3-carboxypropyl)-4-demethylwyosine(37)-N(4)]-methyltransferase n=1 Tax=Mortierella polycephala TaxID=41804 RepID=A0A9P6TYM9_9FUNG|nr:hypothetical protein BG011_006703 [Mortierella polycephala]
MSDGFLSRKKAILIALNSDTPDKSPKGYVDEPLLPLIILINNHKDYVTTSSCSGRICTYLEGMDESSSSTSSPQDDRNDSSTQELDDDATQVSKGYEENTSLAAVEAAKRAKGGQWLYVSHDPVDFPTERGRDLEKQWIINTLFGPEAHRVVTMEESILSGVDTQTEVMTKSQLVYFKFEPMILHIEAATPMAAKSFLNHSLFSGYRNSGILPSAKRTMLAIRSTLKIDAPVAYIPTGVPSSSTTTAASGTGAETPDPKIHLMVSLQYLRMLIELSNDKFRMNVAQMSRFEQRLKEHLLQNDSTDGSEKKKMGDQGEWEDKEARKERKRKEGLEKQELAAKVKAEAEARHAAEQQNSEAQPDATATQQ